MEGLELFPFTELSRPSWTTTQGVASLSADGLPPLYVLNEQGTPVREHSFAAWSEWISRGKNRRIAKTKFGTSLEVSTVFLGIDHGNGILFHTRAARDGQTIDEDEYDSREDALLGHDRMCARLTDSEPDGDDLC